MSPAPARIAFAAIWHQLPYEDLLALVRHAEALGYEAAYLDGDVTAVPSLADRDVLDGWTVQTALTMATERIALAAIHLVHHWNAARLAHAVASLERLAPGRQRVLVAVGGQPSDVRAGLPFPSHPERVAWLDETLDAMTRLWSEPEVSMTGRFVRLDRASVNPRPDPPPPLEVAAAGGRTLSVVARRAASWNINLPPVPDAVAAASRTLAEACSAWDRDPASVERSLWFFARPERTPDDPATLAEFRRFAPWFARFGDGALRPGFLVGGGESARARLAAASQELALDLPVVDVTGLPLAEACAALDVFAPG